MGRLKAQSSLKTKEKYHGGWNFSVLCCMCGSSLRGVGLESNDDDGDDPFDDDESNSVVDDDSNPESPAGRQQNSGKSLGDSSTSSDATGKTANDSSHRSLVSGTSGVSGPSTTSSVSIRQIVSKPDEVIGVMDKKRRR